MNILRFDLFIIWGNGLNYTPEIISEIREDKNYEIVRLKYHVFNNTDKFIKNIYKCDSVPIKHLISPQPLHAYMHYQTSVPLVFILHNRIPSQFINLFPVEV